MSKPVEKSSVGFRSFDKSSQIKGVLWQPVASHGASGAAPRAIVQIVHGMSEHIGRYEDFARFLVSAGFAVCAHDHIGHGRSVTDPMDLGHMPLDCGKDALIEDVHEMRKTVSARFSRKTPYFIFGHSMGSFVTRAYLSRHAEGLSGAVICGTGNEPVVKSKMGHLLACRVAAKQGERTRSKLLHNLADGAFSKAVKDARTPLDWLSTDPAIVDAYIADDLCGQTFTAGAYATLTSLTAEVATLDSALAIPSELPILLIAGALDPVGNKGRGVKSTAALFEKAGIKDVEVKLYQGMRHEILNEPGKQQVYDDVLAWIDRHIS